MKVARMSVKIIIICACLLAVSGFIMHGMRNDSEDSVDARRKRMRARDAMLMKGLRDIQVSHGPVKDGLAAFLICEQKQFKFGKATPVVFGIVNGEREDGITIQPPHRAIQPDSWSWFSITGPDGKEVPYKAGHYPLRIFRSRMLKRATYLEMRQTSGRLQEPQWTHRLDTPGTYTIKWHYKSPPIDDGSWWQGELVSNEIQIKIVR